MDACLAGAVSRELGPTPPPCLISPPVGSAPPPAVQSSGGGGIMSGLIGSVVQGELRRSCSMCLHPGFAAAFAA